MPTLPRLSPTDTITYDPPTLQATNETGNLATAADITGVSPPDTAALLYSMIVAANAVGHVYIPIQNMPANFSSMTTFSMNIAHSVQTYSNDIIAMYARIYKADKVTPLTNEIQVPTLYGTYSEPTIIFTGVVGGTKTDWDGAVLALRFTYTKSGATDNSRWKIINIVFDGTYVNTVATRNLSSSITATSSCKNISFVTERNLTSQIAGLSSTKNIVVSTAILLYSTIAATSIVKSIAVQGFLGDINVLLPTPGQTVAIPIVFSWEQFAGIDTYQIQVATDALFNTIVLDDVAVGTSFVANNLSAGATYYWRVRALAKPV